MGTVSCEAFFPDIHRYAEAATRRSLYAANTGHPRAINHCHPRGLVRQKIRESRVGRKLGRREKQKKERGGGVGLSVFRFLYRVVASSEKCFIVKRNSGVFSRRSIRYTAGICRYRDKK